MGNLPKYPPGMLTSCFVFEIIYLPAYMQKYIWTEKYSVGVIEINEQHQHFFAIANEIIDMAEAPEIPIRELLFKITNLLWLRQKQKGLTQKG